MPNFYNIIKAKKFSTVSDSAVEISPYDSATPNFRIDAGGKLNWGSGSAATDTNLYRGSANTLKTDDSFNIASGKTYQVDGANVLSATSLGSSVVSSSLTSLGTLTGLTISGTTTLQQSLEKVVDGGNISGTKNINLLTSAVHMFASTNDFTFNFRGDGSTTLNSLMTNGQSITAVIFVTNTTDFGVEKIKIDGSDQDPKWFGGSVPSANEDATDVYTITIIKTESATYTVYGSVSKFA
jgi:hypothetical protein